jgi:phospholipid/cholesterol/gamma-HCH transport system ATP-binding protein
VTESVPLYEISGIEKSFGTHRVLDGVDLVVNKNEFLAIVGESGTGKSLLAKIMLGLVRPDAGKIVFDGEDVTHVKERQWVHVRQRVGVLLQSSGLFDSMSVLDNVAYGLREQRVMDEPAIVKRVAESLAMVALPGTEAMAPGSLSGGMRKRVALARAIAMRPEVLIYDGPTEGLDPINVGRVNRLLAGLRRQMGITTVVITHQMETVFGVADRVLMLADGKIAIEGSPDALWHSEDPRLRPFLNIARAVMREPRRSIG